MTQAGKILEVAAAVLQKPDGTFLLAQRPADKIWAGYWEFPGGKIEAGETPSHALVRELREELGIEARQLYPWITRIFTYPHATVRLHFFRVTQWQGDPHPHEGQQFSWQPPSAVAVEPMLPANAPVLRSLALPALYAISNVKELGKERFLERLEIALRNGLRLVQLREKALPREAMRALALRMLAPLREHEAKLIINADVELAREVGADGVQLTAAQLATLTARPDVPWCAASCHSADELRRAEELGCDFAVLSPVLPTLSHPGEPTLGWEKFSEMLYGATLPVYALGGLGLSDMELAWVHGAHGVALLRQAWPEGLSP
jgi:8-oxo-dGTP diphosphatase